MKREANDMAVAKLYEIGQEAPFAVSRAKLENYVQCPRCFVLDRRHKIAPPSRVRRSR